MRVARHDDRDAVVEQQLLQTARTRRRPSVTSWPPAKNGWPDDRHRRSCRRRAASARFEPALLLRVDRPQHAGVDRRRARSDPSAPRRTARAGSRSARRIPGAAAPPPRSSSSIRPSVVLVRRRSASTRASHAGARGVRLEERRGEAFERVVPVVIAGNRVDRLV